MKMDYRSLRLIGLGIPAAVILCSYIWMAVDHAALDLSDVIVHESGRYTLAGTVFYFSHFLREIPTDLAMALFLVAGRRVAQQDGPRPALRPVVFISALMICVSACC